METKIETSPNGHPKRSIGRGHGAHQSHDGEVHTPSTLSSKTYEHSVAIRGSSSSSSPSSSSESSSKSKANPYKMSYAPTGAGLSVGGSGEKPTKDYGGGGIED